MQPESFDAEGPHEYGPRVHLLGDVWTRSELARISSADTGLGDMLALVRSVYRRLLTTACSRELPRARTEVPTRMVDAHPDAGVWHGELFDIATSVVVVDLIRGGMVPAQTCFEALATLLPGESLRLDHITASRVHDESGTVRGAELSDAKIGGRVDGKVLVLPDPMGATGTTVLQALDHYTEHYGRPAKTIVLTMIGTPEFLRAVLGRGDDTVVYLGRLDRGLSDPEVLAATPGRFWDRERGLDETGYIVPGAGGIGEVLNNSWC